MAESKVTIFIWPRSWHRMVACSCQAAFRNLVLHSTRVWLKCSWIVVITHCRITEEHASSTVENEHHADVRPHCRKFVELQKAIQSEYSHVYLELGELLCYAAGLLKILCAPSCCQMQEWHRCYCKRDLACWLNSPPSAPLECLYSGSNSVCKISRNFTPTSISAGTKPNMM